LLPSELKTREARPGCVELLARPPVKRVHPNTFILRQCFR
jgi:hypothetical protein